MWFKGSESQATLSIELWVRTLLKRFMVGYSQETDGDVWSGIDKSNNPLVTGADCWISAATVWNPELDIEGQISAVGT
jgi:hypothetical protein